MPGRQKDPLSENLGGASYILKAAFVLLVGSRVGNH